MAGDYQELNSYLQHNGKITVVGELSIPELDDLVTPPLADNAIGMKNGIQYKWNRIVEAWEAVSVDGYTVQVDTSINSDTITNAYMNTNYSGYNAVIFTNLSDYPDNVMEVKRIGPAVWYSNLYANKLT